MACDDPIGLGAPPGRLPALSLSAGDSLGGTISDSVYWNVCDRVNRFENRKFPNRTMHPRPKVRECVMIFDDF